MTNKMTSNLKLELLAGDSRETGSTDQFGVVRTISKTTNGSNQSGDFVTVTNFVTVTKCRLGRSEMQDQKTHQRIQKRIMKKRRGRVVRSSLDQHQASWDR